MHFSSGFQLGCIFLITLSSCPPITSHSGMEITAPKIQDILFKCTGQRYKFTCTVKAGGLEQETLVYWLANDNFVEKVFDTTRVKTKTKLIKEDFLQNVLVIKGVKLEDLQTNFTCIALSPAGFDKETINCSESTAVSGILPCKHKLGKSKI